MYSTFSARLAVIFHRFFSLPMYLWFPACVLYVLPVFSCMMTGAFRVVYVISAQIYDVLSNV